MISLDPISIAASVVELAKFASGLARAEEEVKNFLDQLNETATLLDGVLQSLERYGSRLPPDDRRRIEATTTRIHSEVNKARSLGENYLKTPLSERPCRALRWVLNGRNRAEMYRQILRQHRDTLGRIESQLLALGVLSFALNSLFSLPPMRQIPQSNTPRIQYLGKLHLSLAPFLFKSLVYL